MKIFERKIQGIAGSLLVTLPKGWATSLHLKKGSILRFAITKQGTAILSPEIIRQEEKKETVMEYDENIVRKFFREYLAGYEKIIIKFTKKATKEEKKKLYAFLKKFMNVQIIEETEEKIVLKSFKIEELSIKECLNRMFYLTLNMIDELKNNNDQMKQKEIEVTTKRFYYMLVMQIRRFIGEGKFTEQNQISLIRAMDCRLVGANIERISEYILDSENLKSKEIKKMLEEITEYYKKSVAYFINNKYQKALTLWAEERRIKGRYESLLKKTKRAKDLAAYKQVNDFLYILKLAKHISMLIR